MRGLLGTTHSCDSCGYEVLLGPGHHVDFALCIACGADFAVVYPGGIFSHCTQQAPGVLWWYDSESLKADDRDNETMVREGVLPQPDSALPDLSADCCPRCKQGGTLRLSVPDVCECPKCHAGVLQKTDVWIQ